MEDPSNQKDILTENTAAEAGKSGFHKRFQKPLLIISVMIAVVFAVLIIFNILIRPYDKTMSTYSNFTVEEGSSTGDVADGLEKAGIIGNAGIFRLTSSMVFASDFKPGTYYLSPSMDSVSIAKALCKGNITTNGFIIPDGFSMDQTFSSLARDGFGDEKAFMEAAADPFLSELDFIGTDVAGSEQVEGFLMPGTYRLESGADEAMIIYTMLDSFDNFFNDDYRARADELGLSIRDVIVIASMIERDTSIDSEKAQISSVIHNKLNLGIIAPEDFPDVPLCSPGEASVIAALYPSEDENTYYVLSDKLDGTHVFTDSESEYNALVESYNAAKTARDESIRSKHDESSESADEE